MSHRFFLLLCACLGGFFTAGLAYSDTVDVERLTTMPEPVSNNAVVMIRHDGKAQFLSLLGLGAGKEHTDIHARAWRLDGPNGQWQTIPRVPGNAGRLASIAVQVGGQAWVMGGYTVDEDGHEVSTPQVMSWGIGEAAWTHRTDMPIPVDDATAHVYQDRYLYLVSGWHDLGNVNLVQVLDTQTLEWQQATPYPGNPVFGHAGGTSGANLVVCGGVRIQYRPGGEARQFLPSSDCWLGEIDAENHRRILWQPLPAHPGAPRYRAAAVADGQGRIVFAGGAANPYNFNGVGYNGVPSEPEAGILVLDIENRSWSIAGQLSAPTMDHRGLLHDDGWFYVLGGMYSHQQVSADAYRFRLD